MNNHKDEIQELFDGLDPNSWEANCSLCGTYYTGVFPESGNPQTICPNCESDRCCFGSPAGGKNILMWM